MLFDIEQFKKSLESQYSVLSDEEIDDLILEYNSERNPPSRNLLRAIESMTIMKFISNKANLDYGLLSEQDLVDIFSETSGSIGSKEFHDISMEIQKAIINNIKRY